MTNPMLPYSYSLKCNYTSSKYCLTSTLLFIEKILYLEMDNHSSIRKEKYKTSNIFMSIWGWVKGSIFSILNKFVSALNLSSNGKIIESIFLYNLHRYKLLYYVFYLAADGFTTTGRILDRLDRKWLTPNFITIFEDPAIVEHRYTSPH